MRKLDSFTKRDIEELIVFVLVGVLMVIRFDEVLQLISYIIDILFPFIVGGAIAFVFHVPMNALEKHVFSRIKKLKSQKLKRLLSFLLTTILFMLVVTLILNGVVPQISSAFSTLTDKIPSAYNKFAAWIEPYYEKWPTISEWIDMDSIDWQSLSEKALEFLRTSGIGFFSSTVGAVSDVVTGVGSILIGFVFSLYIVFQKEHLSQQAKKIMYGYIKERSVDKILDVLRMANEIFSNFISGQVLEAIILGCMFWIVLGVFNFPYASMIGLIIGATAIIPILGSFIGFFIGEFMILVIEPEKAIWFLVIFLVLQQIEGNAIYPYVVGGKIGLPSIWVLVAVTVGGSLMGILGIILFIPLFSLIYALLRDSTRHRLRVKGIEASKIRRKP